MKNNAPSCDEREGFLKTVYMTLKIRHRKDKYQDLIDGKIPFFSIEHPDLKAGDEVNHVEYDHEKQEETGRQTWARLVHVFRGEEYGLKDGWVGFVNITYQQADFLSYYDELTNKILPEFENKLSSKYGGNILERMRYVLTKFSDTTETAVLKAKNFCEDFKVQIKALELIIEGLTDEGYNHSQKRVIANHCINTIRKVIDRIDNIEFDYTNSMYDRFSFFRSTSPERGLLQRYRDLKDENNRLKIELNRKVDEPVKDDIPF